MQGNAGAGLLLVGLAPARSVATDEIWLCVMGLGQKTDKVSTREELLKDKNTCGAGAPAHTPEVAAQTYVDTATGQVYEWWKGEWH